MKATQKDIREQLDFIKNALKSFPAGASIDELMAFPGISMELRTLQRRLKALQDEGVVRTTGDTRSTRYHLVETKKEEPPKPQEEQTIPLTEESKEVLSLVSRPESKRKPVGYHREFLEFYEPNVTSFLTPEEKQKLLALGKTSGQDQAAGTYAKKILQRLLIDLSYNSSRLEGNTYSLLDTERLIELGEKADDKSTIDAQMIINHKDAIEFIVQTAEEIELNRYIIMSLHALLSNNLLGNPAASGSLRNHAVGIGKSVYTPLSIPQQIEEMFDLILDKARRIENPFEQAFFLMVHLPYLQPFEDVNKRVSRLAVNIPLNKHNLAPLSFVQVPGDLYIRGLLGVYELNRVELLKDVFIYAYERSSARYAQVRHTIGEPDRFILKYREEIKSLVAEIITSAMGHKQAADRIKEAAKQLPKEDQAKFIEYVETELMSLHEGNFARYWVRPAEFNAWKEIWEKK